MEFNVEGNVALFIFIFIPPLLAPWAAYARYP